MTIQCDPSTPVQKAARETYHLAGLASFHAKQALKGTYGTPDHPALLAVYHAALDAQSAAAKAFTAAYNPTKQGAPQ